MSSRGVGEGATVAGSIEFVSPLGIDICATRLLGRDEPAVWLAWDWQTRLSVRVVRVEPTRCRFTLKRVSRSKLELPVALGAVRGELRALDGEHTLVTAQQRLGWLWWLALAIIVAAALLMVVATQSSPDPLPPGEALLLLAAMAGGSAVIAGVLWLIVRRQMHNMLALVREVLGG